MDDITPQYNPAPIVNTDVSARKKKIFLIVGIAVVLILIAVLIYVLILRKPSTTTPGGETFPIGGNTQTSEQPISNIGSETGTTGTAGVGTTELKKLVELYKGPVAGYTLLPDGRTLRLFDRTLGRLVEVNANSGIAVTVSDQPILGIHDATFLANDKLILRGVDDSGIIKSTLYTITETSSPVAPLLLSTPTTLADNILEIAQNPDGSKAVLLIKDPLGANIDQLDTASQTLSRKGTLPLTEWIPTITNSGTIYLSAKASRFAESGTYELRNKKLILSISAAVAQTANISPTGAIAYVSGSYGGVYSADVRDPNILSTVEGAAIPFITLGEKCAWTQDENALYCGVPNTRGTAFPDDWYLGVMHSSDTMHRFNFNTNADEFLFNPSAFNAVIDMVNVTPSTNAVFLKNRTDEHLWMYRLTNTNTDGGSTVENPATTTPTSENL